MKFHRLIVFILCLIPGLAVAESTFELRGDQGVLQDLRPQAALWLSDDRILVSDLALNDLHIFDLEGRRYLQHKAPDGKAPAQYVGLTQLNEDEFLALGSHYHHKNHIRYRKQRSRLNKFTLKWEELSTAEFDKNLAPIKALTMKRFWGSSPKRQVEFCGLALDKSHDAAWLAMVQPASEDGGISLLRCSLKKLLAQDEDLELREISTGFKPPLEERCQLPSYLSDIAMLDDGSLLLLLTAEDMKGGRLCANSLWHWTPGKKAKLVKDDLALENRATGLAVRSLGKRQYKVALVCDNNFELTKVPPRLVILGSPLKL